MKIEPILFENINTTHTSFKLDFHLDANITFIKGDSGVGKSAVFSFLEEMAAEDSRIKKLYDGEITVFSLQKSQL